MKVGGIASTSLSGLSEAVTIHSKGNAEISASSDIRT
jgi:hypothetical protein